MITFIKNILQEIELIAPTTKGDKTA